MCSCTEPQAKAVDCKRIWQINDVCSTKDFAYTSARKKTDGAPWFEDGDSVSVDSASADSVTLSFPQAEDDVCVYGYRITLKDPAHPKKRIEKEIYSGYYFEPMPERLCVTIERLTAGTEYDVTVTPLNVWLKAGEPITCQFTSPQN